MFWFSFSIRSRFFAVRCRAISNFRRLSLSFTRPIHFYIYLYLYYSDFFVFCVAITHIPVCGACFGVRFFIRLFDVVRGVNVCWSLNTKKNSMSQTERECVKNGTVYGHCYYTNTQRPYRLKYLAFTLLCVSCAFLYILFWVGATHQPRKKALTKDHVAWSDDFYIVFIFCVFTLWRVREQACIMKTCSFKSIRWENCMTLFSFELSVSERFLFIYLKEIHRCFMS